MQKSNKVHEKWIYFVLGIPAYFMIYFGLEGLKIITGKFALYNYSSYSYGGSKTIINFYNYVPGSTLAPIFIVGGGLIIVGLYIHYYWENWSYHK